jgi:predicted acylesterase/phospholipase RssA
VLGRLHSERIPIEAVVGCSVGAIVGAMHAAVGMSAEDMIAASRRLTTGALISFALSRWGLPVVSRPALRRSGAIPGFLQDLERATFDRLHHGVRRLALLTYDLLSREEVLVQGGPGVPAPLTPLAAVKASAAIPVLFPPLRASIGGRKLLLVDPGWITAVPVERAFALPIGARRVIAVDLSIRVCVRQSRPGYWSNLEQACGDRLAVLRPDVRACGTLFSRPGDVDRLVAAAEAAVSGPSLERIRSWIPRETAWQAGFLDTLRDGC